MSKDVGGRPTVMTEDVLHKLDEAFLLGCTDAEACFYADISSTAFYNYQESTEGYRERKEQLKQNPFFLARQSVIKGFSNPDLALKYLERKKKDEFSLRQELTGTDGKNLMPEDTHTAEELKRLSDQFNDFLKQSSTSARESEHPGVDTEEPNKNGDGGNSQL